MHLHPHPVYPIPNPLLTEVVYPRMGKNGNFWVLWDLQNNQEMLELSENGIFNEIPAWSPDGMQFVVDLVMPDWKTEEFFSISSNGKEVSQITHFIDYIANDTKIKIQQFSLSPDGRYIAFWVAIDPSSYSGERLAILDLKTMEVTNYCVRGSDSLNENGSAAPLWAPNSQQLAVESYDDEGYVHTVLVDIAHNTAFNIADSVRPTAWTIN